MSNLYNKPTLPQQRPATIQQTDADPTTLNIPTTVLEDTTYGTYRTYADGTTHGRVLPASVLRSNATALTTNVAKTITSISIPSHSKWRVVAMGGVATAGGTIPTRLAISISKTTNALSAANTQNVPTDGEVLVVDFIPAVGGNEADIQAESIYENTNDYAVTLYMVLQLTFTVSTATGYGSIFAESIA